MAEPLKHVPDELMVELREATRRLQETEKGVEDAMDSAEYRHQERINAAKEEFQKAEGELEKVDGKIKAVLKPSGDAE